MKPTFNPKETIAAIINATVTTGIVINGGTPDQAAALGSVAEGLVKGIGSKPAPTGEHIKQLLIDSVKQAINDYELPDDCKYRIPDEIFTQQNISRLIQSQEPDYCLQNFLIEICRDSSDCDTDTLPAESITNAIILNLHTALINDPALTGIYTSCLVQDMHKDIKSIYRDIQVLTKKQSACAVSDSQLFEISFNTADKSIKGLSAPLFAEDSQQVQKTLSDVHVESRLFSSGDTFINFDSLHASLEKDEPLLIEGEAGMGKSTLVMFLAKRYLTGEIFKGQKVFFVSGKEIRHSKGNPEEDLKKYLSIPEVEALEGSILILDAYDEIAYASQSQEHNQSYLKKLCRCLEGVTLIITCRTGYVHNFPGTTAKLLGFDCSQRQTFLEKYNSKKEEDEQLDEDIITELSKEHTGSDTENIDELLKIPMLLYMIAVSRINIHEITDRYSLYEKVFGPERRQSILRRNRKISKDIWDDCYILAKSIAHQMFMLNDLYISYDTVLQQIEDLQFGTERTKTLKNCFGIEIFLRSEEDQLFTFVHSSIYEYFSAKWICDAFRNLLEKWLHHDINIDTLQKQLNTVFSADHFENTVFRYIMQNISAGYFTPLLQHSTDDLLNLSHLMNQLITSQLCTSGNTSVPYAIRLKNMLLWVFNTFNMLFGMVTIHDDPYWVKTNLDIVSFLLRAKEQRDTLFLSHIDLENIHMSKADMGVTYIIEANLNGADFSYTQCDGITCINQTFEDMDFEFSDWSGGCLGNCLCSRTKFSCSDFSYGSIEYASFRNCDFAATEFTECRIIESTFIDCDFRETVWNKTFLHNCSFQNVLLYRSDLKEIFPDTEIYSQIILTPDKEDPEVITFSATIDKFTTV